MLNMIDQFVPIKQNFSCKIKFLENPSNFNDPGSGSRTYLRVEYEGQEKTFSFGRILFLQFRDKLGLDWVGKEATITKVIQHKVVKTKMEFLKYEVEIIGD